MELMGVVGIRCECAGCEICSAYTIYRFEQYLNILLNKILSKSTQNFSKGILNTF